MNITRKTYENEWVEALSQILTDARDLLLGSAVEEQCSEDDPEHKPNSKSGNDQMLLPGIDDPHGWDFSAGK